MKTTDRLGALSVSTTFTFFLESLFSSVCLSVCSVYIKLGKKMMAYTISQGTLLDVIFIFN